MQTLGLPLILMRQSADILSTLRFSVYQNLTSVQKKTCFWLKWTKVLNGTVFIYHNPEPKFRRSHLIGTPTKKRDKVCAFEGILQYVYEERLDQLFPSMKPTGRLI